MPVYIIGQMNELLIRAQVGSTPPAGTLRKIMDKIVIFIIAWIISILLSGLIILWAWNLFIPGVVGRSELSYWQAQGLAVSLRVIVEIFK